jgi:predicted dehydrogenase
MSIKFGVVGNNHGHIYWMIKGLLGTGQADCVGYFTLEPELNEEMKRAFPQIPLVKSEAALLENPQIQLICTAARNDLRADIAIRAMKCGKDVFVDKPGVTTLDHLDELQRVQKETGKSWFVFFCERLPDPTSQKAIELVQKGEIGRLVNFIGIEPHKLNRTQRPDWMFKPDQYGGIINDLGIHPIEMFCQLVNEDVKVDFSRVGNFAHPDLVGFQDFGEVVMKSASGATAYVRADWLSPDSIPSYGDVRQLIIGTEGMIELRKTLDFAVDNDAFTGHQLLMANHKKAPRRIVCKMKKEEIFGKIVIDINEGTNRSIPQETSFLATRLSLLAQTGAQ